MQKISLQYKTTLKAMKLTAEQLKEIKSKGWNPIVKGAYLNLYKNDFRDETVFNELCEIAGQDQEEDILTVLIIGTKQEYKTIKP